MPFCFFLAGGWGEKEGGMGRKKNNRGQVSGSLKDWVTALAPVPVLLRCVAKKGARSKKCCVSPGPMRAKESSFSCGWTGIFRSLETDRVERTKSSIHSDG